MKSLVSIILPTFNEVENIKHMIDMIVVQFSKADEFEILVVDDNSIDGTIELVKKVMPRVPQLKLIVRLKEHGLIPSICEGIRAAKGDICIWMDADLSMDPALIPQFIAKLESGADLVLGSRYIHGGGMKGADLLDGKRGFIRALKRIRKSQDSLISALVSKFGNILIRFILHPDIHDYSSGFFGARKRILESNMPSGSFVDYCISLPFGIISKGYVVKEVPMVLKTREFGKSKTSDSFYSILKISIQCFSLAIKLRLKSFFSKRMHYGHRV